jgi:hypothetical protein
MMTPAILSKPVAAAALMKTPTKLQLVLRPWKLPLSP